jgi:SAM-dependent methyltransferase
MKDNEGVRVTDAPCCLLCGGEGKVLYSGLRDRLFGAPGIWTLMQCPKCQLVWINPQPTPDDVGKLYTQYFTHTTLNSVPKNSSALRKLIKASILASSFGYSVDGSNIMLGSLLSLIGPLKEIVGGGVRWLGNDDKGRLLDVGCGNGSFLDQMRSLDWEVAGVEPDGEAVSVASERYGLNVFRGSLEEADFPAGHFDAITVNHVIEHAPDPIGLLKECRRVLKPDGKLVVVTPNINSLGRRMFDESWLHWDPPRHLHLFSTQTLRACAEAARLDIQELRTIANGASQMWVASSHIRRDGVLKGGSSKKAVGFSLRLQVLAFYAVEHELNGLWQTGEELVLQAVR